MNKYDRLKSLYLNPTYLVEVYEQNDFSPSLTLKYYGDYTTGAFNLYGMGLSSQQKKYKYVELDSSIWVQLVERIEQFMAIPKDERETDSGYVVNAHTRVEVKTSNDHWIVDYGIDSPNKLVRNFINTMFGFCPILSSKSENI